MPEYINVLQRAVVPDSPSYYGYGPPWGPATTAVASALGERLGLELDPQDIVLTRGASSGLALLMHALIDPGDQVVMMSPPWFFYEAMVLAASAEPVRVPLSEADFSLDPDAVEQAITPRTRPQRPHLSRGPAAEPRLGSRKGVGTDRTAHLSAE